MVPANLVLKKTATIIEVMKGVQRVKWEIIFPRLNWEPITQPRPLPLAAGTVFTIEPGVYKAGHYGIRIEDDVLATREKPVRLTQSTRELRIIRRKL